jgi:hypothetical protein
MFTRDPEKVEQVEFANWYSNLTRVGFPLGFIVELKVRLTFEDTVAKLVGELVITVGVLKVGGGVVKFRMAPTAGGPLAPWTLILK